MKSVLVFTIFFSIAATFNIFAETVKKEIKMKISRDSLDKDQALKFAIKEFNSNPTKYFGDPANAYKSCKILSKRNSVYTNEKQPNDMINDKWNVTLNVACEKHINTQGRNQKKETTESNSISESKESSTQAK
jgi:hypothetical protein